MIVEKYDTVLARNLALIELRSLVKQKDFVRVLSLENVFIKFLKKCFEMFHEDTNKLELCVDTLLLAGLSVSQLDEFGFGEVLDMLGAIERYCGLVKNLRGDAGPSAGARRRTPRRVSFQEARNEVRYYVKEEEAHFKHGGYTDKDRNEAHALRAAMRHAEAKSIDWFAPERLRLVWEEERPKSLYRASEEKAQRTSFEITNTDPSVDFFPCEAHIPVVDNESKWLPLISYGARNMLPEMEAVDGPVAAVEVPACAGTRG
ncbi:UNVERIFIED_CONTAM: hypothetical protein PYX00_011590 [Menopon gallinae]|uniref:Uncharacterized protein n=1 Tax=Menopon gallinae TaxID=328185 RepID=A0AAW2H817_9NEOP